MGRGANHVWRATRPYHHCREGLRVIPGVFVLGLLILLGYELYALVRER